MIKKSNKNLLKDDKKKIIYLLVIGVLILIISYFSFILYSSQFKEEYQAVFLTNGQVYFGHLDSSRELYELTDIYYLQVNQDLQRAAEDVSNKPDLTLIKLGEELHGPTDRMLINRDQVLFVEDLKQNSKVIKSIKEDQSL